MFSSKDLWLFHAIGTTRQCIMFLLLTCQENMEVELYSNVWVKKLSYESNDDLYHISKLRVLEGEADKNHYC